jgi:hypothetical protein
MPQAREEKIFNANGTKHSSVAWGDDASQHRTIAHLSTAFHGMA